MAKESKELRNLNLKKKKNTKQKEKTKEKKEKSDKEIKDASKEKKIKHKKREVKSKKVIDPVLNTENNYTDIGFYMKEKQVPDIKELQESVLQCIIGQDEQVKEIITAIYRAIFFPMIKSNILIIGKSGVGKTETIKQIAARLHIPYTIEDATKYTQEGYYGADVTDMLYNLLDNANNNVGKAERGIIVIDEIDKKAGNNGEHDVSGVEVLKSLLKIIEGTKVVLPLPYVDEVTGEFGDINFDTKNLIIVFMGAFAGLDKIREKRLNTNQLGFATQSTTKIQTTRFIKKDLINYGMPEEFVGRLDTIIEMNSLNKVNLTQILKASKLSIFKKYQTELFNIGILMSYSSEIFEAIAEESLSIDTGARELSNIVNRIFEKIIYEVLSNPGKFKKCMLSMDIIHDNSKYILS